jgi:hypothetical protein
MQHAFHANAATTKSDCPSVSVPRVLASYRLQSLKFWGPRGPGVCPARPGTAGCAPREAMPVLSHRPLPFHFTYLATILMPEMSGIWMRKIRQVGGCMSGRARQGRGGAGRPRTWPARRHPGPHSTVMAPACTRFTQARRTWPATDLSHSTSVIGREPSGASGTRDAHISHSSAQPGASSERGWLADGPGGSKAKGAVLHPPFPAWPADM